MHIIEGTPNDIKCHQRNGDFTQKTAKDNSLPASLGSLPSAELLQTQDRPGG